MVSELRPADGSHLTATFGPFGEREFRVVQTTPGPEVIVHLETLAPPYFQVVYIATEQGPQDVTVHRTGDSWYASNSDFYHRAARKALDRWRATADARLDVPRCVNHGPMTLRKPTTKEQAFCGTWYVCGHPSTQCRNTVLVPSPELLAQLGVIGADQ